jgi:hypothetical protein
MVSGTNKKDSENSCMKHAVNETKSLQDQRIKSRRTLGNREYQEFTNILREASHFCRKGEFPLDVNFKD